LRLRRHIFLQFPRYFSILLLLFFFKVAALLRLKSRFLLLNFQELRSNLTIPVVDKPRLVFLGPMGDVDPTEMINFETSRIPFKHASLDLADWDSCFTSWTGYTKGWRNWYRRVPKKNRDFWEQYKISQCITLSLSEMPRNEFLLIAASYFWSDALNAFFWSRADDSNSGRCSSVDWLRRFFFRYSFWLSE
jgi:hypothetical protein